MTRDPASLLTELILLAQQFVCERWRGELPAVERLRMEVAAAIARPEPDERYINDECLLMVQVLGLVLRNDHDGERRRLFLQIVGALIPAIRQALSRAVDARRLST